VFKIASSQIKHKRKRVSRNAETSVESTQSKGLDLIEKEEVIQPQTKDPTGRSDSKNLIDRSLFNIIDSKGSPSKLKASASDKKIEILNILKHKS